MNRVLLFSLAGSILFFIHPARGAVFERDWKTPGDGLLTFDDVNRREWLDLPLQLILPTPRYENVVAELGPGGIFEGFTVGRIEDLVALVHSAGVSISSTDIAVNGGPVSHVIDLLGEVGTSNIGNRRALGQLADTFPFEPFPPAHVGGEFYEFPSRNEAGFRTLGIRLDGFPNPNLPVYLYRSAIPEAGTMALALSSIVILLLCRCARP